MESLNQTLFAASVIFLTTKGISIATAIRAGGLEKICRRAPKGGDGEKSGTQKESLILRLEKVEIDGELSRWKAAQRMRVSSN